MARSDMSDLEWEFIKAGLPNNTRGKKRVDDRRVINGIFYVLRTGLPWADLPSEYGRPTTVYNRFNRWSYAGHWDRIMAAIADVHNVDTVMVDGTSVRAHHSATTSKKRPAPLFRSLTGRIRACRVKLNSPDRLNALGFTNAASTCLVNTSIRSNPTRSRHENTCTYQSEWAANPI